MWWGPVGRVNISTLGTTRVDMFRVGGRVRALLRRSGLRFVKLEGGTGSGTSQSGQQRLFIRGLRLQVGSKWAYPGVGKRMRFSSGESIEE